MATSSSPSPIPITTPQGGYDVFISFRGKDTRNNFISHLHASLCQKLVLSFIDSKHLRGGDEISASLFNAIEGSKLYLVIFSPNYASSKWCLLELEKILEFKKMKRKTVIPVFYKVDPSQVRYQMESFGDTFCKHEGREEMDRVQRWREILKEAASLSGWASLDARSEFEFLENIVNNILEELNKLSTPNSRGLVGIDRHVEELKSLLCMESPSPRVCSVGIWGMGGIGKTTIAKAFFDRFYSLFSGFYFFENVREELERHGAIAFYNKLVQEILDDKDAFKGSRNLEFSFIKERLRRKRIVIVFDDVDNSIQLSNLVEHHDLFGPGSKIVMTCRDKQVLKNLLVDEVYKVEGLHHDEAVQLFSMNAFKNNCPPIGHKKLVERLVRYAKGNPLALKVLGSALFGRDKEYWECAQDRIEKFPEQKILAVLRVSYDGLPIDEKNIFLDIACFFKGEDKDSVIEILDKHGGAPYCCVTNLIDKCLVTISSNNKLEMHHLLQEMGRAIEREKPRNLEERSRLFDPKEILDVLRSKKGTEAIQSVIFDLSKIAEMHLPIDAFKGMNNLRLLKITGWNPGVHILGHDIQHSPNKLSYLYQKAFQFLGWNLEAPIFGDGLGALFNQLRYLYWDNCPLKSFASTFCGERIVKLSLPKGKFEKLWEGKQHLGNLKWVDLRWCRDLAEIPDLCNAKNIKTIDLAGCGSLIRLHSSVQYLTNLESLDLFYCKSLRYLPSSLDSKSLQRLGLRACPIIQKCPHIISRKLRWVFLDGNGIKEVPQFIEDCKLLECLAFSSKSMIKFPEVSTTIEDLTLSGAGIEEVPSSIQSLTMLIEVPSLSFSRSLSHLPTTICKLKSLRYLFLQNCPKLEGLPEILEPMEALRHLDLSNCYNLKRLPNTISNLKSLVELDITNCKLIRFIPRIPQSLRLLEANNCESLQTLSIRNCDFRSMRFINCHKLYEKSRRKVATHLKYTGCCFISLPGTEIPQWFPHRSVGSSIIVPLPATSKDLLGMSLCLICQSIPPSHGIFTELKIKCYDEFNTNVIFETEMHSSMFHEPDHLLLLNFGRDFLTWQVSLSKCSKASIEFCHKPGLVQQCGVYFHFGEEYSISRVEECNSSNSEEFSNGSDEECSESMVEDAHSKGGCDDYYPNNAQVSTITRASDEEEEEKQRPMKKVKTQ